MHFSEKCNVRDIKEREREEVYINLVSNERNAFQGKNFIHRLVSRCLEEIREIHSAEVEDLILLLLLLLNKQ